jgi:hypothetical protein
MFLLIKLLQSTTKIAKDPKKPTDVCIKYKYFTYEEIYY